MLLLDCGDFDWLDGYTEVIRSFVTQFGDECWFRVARADVVKWLVSTCMERLRRELRATPNFGYTDAALWAAAFMAASGTTSSGPRSSRHLPHCSSPATNGNNMGGRKKQPTRAPRRNNSRPARRGYTGDDKSVKDAEGVYTKNRGA